MGVLDAVYAGLILLVFEELVRRYIWPRLFGEQGAAEAPKLRGSNGRTERDEVVEDSEIDVEEEPDDDEWTIMATFATAEDGCLWIGEVEDIPELDDLSQARVRYHLDRLEGLGLIEGHVSTEYMIREGQQGDRWYELTHAGRAFVVEHDLDQE